MADAQRMQDLERQLQELQAIVANAQVLGASTSQASQSNIISQQLPPPEKFSMLDNDWEPWIDHYERYRKAANLSRTPEETQINHLLLYLGPKVNKVFERMQKKQEDFSTYKDLKQAFNMHYQKKINVIYERAKFNVRKQKENETATEYINEIITLAKSCKYGDLEDELIRDRLIVGVRDQTLSEILQLDDTLTLSKTIDKIKQAETIKCQNKEIRNQNEPIYTVDRVQQQQYSKKNIEKRSQTNYEQCGRCGKKPSHRLKECPALKAKCEKCGILGHYRKFCRTKRTRYVDKESESSTSNSEHEFSEIKIINKISKQGKPWSVDLEIDKKIIQFKIDTGADATVMSKDSYKLIRKKYPIKTTTAQLVGPGKGNNQKLETLGRVRIPIRYKGQEKELKMYVVNTNDNLLGRPELKKLGIVTWNENILEIKEANVHTVPTEIRSDQIDHTNYYDQLITRKFKNAFQGLGLMKNMEYKIRLEEDATPYVITAPRRVPIPLLEDVRKEIQNMVEQGVIEKINEPTEWCAPMVVVRKNNGKIRICTDFTKLNKYVKRERYQLPAVEETLAQVQDGKVFSKLDCSSGFWQLPLSKESQKLTTFITPYGRFIYKRCPFGISSIPEVFQKQISQIIDTCGLTGVRAHSDDIIVSGATKAEHDRNLEIVLKTLEQYGITLNAKKCKLGVSEINYLGYIVSDKGIRPDPNYINAIVEYPEPKCVTEVRRFLGIITYLMRFIENYSTKTHALRELLHKNNEFVWGPEQRKCFEELKKTISTVPILATYNTNYRTRVSTDASAYGVGGVLEQLQPDDHWRPVFYCSKALTATEQRYAQIEKECLAITFACNRLNQFLIGKKFEVRTDHKPLISILTQKPINDLTPRLQNFRLKLSTFDYKVTYVPGKELYVPDALSRAPLIPLSEEDDTVETINMKMINNIITVNENYFKEDQNKESTLRTIRNYIEEGWPEKHKVDPSVLPYYKSRDNIGISDDLLLYEDRIIIPPTLRKKCLQDIHTGHLGISKCKARARQSVWWPNINKEIEELVNNCERCLKNKPTKVEPLLQLTTPSIPWHTVSSDLFDLAGETYIVVQDYYSLYIEVEKLRKIDSREIIKKLKKIFSLFGIPNVVRSDNGKQYDSAEFREFANAYGFKWRPSSPKYPQSNGLAESAVKTAKKILKRSDDPYLGLLAYRNTPLECGASPSQLLMSRVLREKMPIQQEKLKPKIIDTKSIQQQKEQLKRKQKYYYDKRHNAKDQRNLEAGERVWITDMGREGKIEKKEGLRSYLVSTDKRKLKRNRRNLQPLPPILTSEPVEESPEPPRRSRRTVTMPRRFHDFVK